ncbi:MAG: hypothetical protein KatS3mg110_4099 [Pirellulaceae bacterium]|nr:MAG: hypothetical protein KatS3mg110_4099 [Pirellulaceae bacterium]
MASIATDRRGNRRLLFVDNNGIRRTVRLGKVSLRVAESIKCRIEHIVAAKCAGAPLDADTARWLGQHRRQPSGQAGPGWPV